jgi:hypothetical protein
MFLAGRIIRLRIIIGEEVAIRDVDKSKRVRMAFIDHLTIQLQNNHTIMNRNNADWVWEDALPFFLSTSKAPTLVSLPVELSEGSTSGSIFPSARTNSLHLSPHLTELATRRP